MKIRIFLPVLAAALITLSFSVWQTETSSEGEELTELVKTELYFGLSKNTGGYVSQEEWDAFEDSVIVKIFSSGSTTLEAKGRWMNENGDVIKENSKLVIALNEMTPELSEKIDLIREKYKKSFNQSSVLRIDYRTNASF
jgi:hypothetical protein